MSFYSVVYNVFRYNRINSLTLVSTDVGITNFWTFNPLVPGVHRYGRIKMNEFFGLGVNMH